MKQVKEMVLDALPILKIILVPQSETQEGLFEISSLAMQVHDVYGTRAPCQWNETLTVTNWHSIDYDLV